MLRTSTDDLWNSAADVITVTTNNVFNSNGELVMGGGCALEAKLRYPNLPRLAGEIITTPDFYGFVVIRNIGLLQTKYHYRNPSTLELIGKSLVVMNDWLTTNSGITLACAYPGIGLGGLTKKQVEPVILNSLSSTVLNRVTFHCYES